MKIYNKLVVVLAMVLAGAGQVMSATARSYETAKRQASQRKPIVMFCYGANYDKVSEAAYESFIKKRGITKAVREAVFLPVPIYQNPSEKEKREYDRIMEGQSIPGGIWSYPCLAVLDAEGNLRGIVQGADQMKDPETAAAALEPLLEAYQEQEKLLDKAASSSGRRQIQLIAEAADYPTNLPRNPLARKGKSMADVKDKTGSLASRFSFDPLSVVEKLQTMEFDEAHRYVRNLVYNGCYSRRQRQEIMAAYAGHVRRHNGSGARLRALYNEMKAIDPTSIYAAYADGAIELWVVPREKNPDAFKPVPIKSGKTAMGDTKAPSAEEGEEEETSEE